MIPKPRVGDEIADAAVDVRGTHGDPPGSGVVYLLMFNDPDDPSPACGSGWTLVAWQGTTQQWSIGLEARGASTRADPRLARAVAVRVLDGRGVRVENWSEDVTGPLPMHRAVLRPRTRS